MDVLGRIHSFQSLGTVDGPGVRFVAFLQGCPLRCKCCHNPDTWDMSGGSTYTANQVIERAKRCKEYFGEKGGITLSGGEPLMQPEFATEIFKLAKQNGINTCLDTSGCLINEKVIELLNVTDRVLLDIKYVNADLYLKNVGCSIEKPLEFLNVLQEMSIPVTIRQVIIPTVNDSEEDIITLKNLAKEYTTVDKIELLPFKKICTTKYDQMGIEFPFANIPEPSGEVMQKLNSLIK
ncbi:MAG: pyruvate formate lyase-activating protein [Clostridia bacterium]|nr:pyruvate formate lyase-activating protein [Clostridia bacterium]